MKGKSCNVLSRHESYLLCKWMDDRREHAGQASAEVLAKEAAKALGFAVSFSNIYSTRHILNIAPRNGPVVTGALGRRVTVLEECVRTVCIRLGLPMPDPTDGPEGGHA